MQEKEEGEAVGGAAEEAVDGGTIHFPWWANAEVKNTEAESPVDGRTSHFPMFM